MSEGLKDEQKSDQPGEESEVVMLIKQVQQQMVYLEKKLDLLLAQAPQKSFNREGSFSRPPRRPFGDSSFRHGKGRPHHSRPSGGGFSNDRSSYDRPREGGFSGERKKFSHDRPSFDRGQSGNSFDRPQAQGGGNYKPFVPKERFFGKKKERKSH